MSATIQMKTLSFLPPDLHGNETGLVDKAALDAYIRQELEASISLYADRIDRFRLHWIKQETAKDCQPHILNLMTVQDFVRKMMDLYVLGSYANIQ